MGFYFYIHKLLIFSFYAFIIFSTHQRVSACTINQAGHESEYGYIEDNGNGPSEWGNIKPEWTACVSGKLQSPINLDDDKVLVDPKITKLETHYKSAPTVAKNRGHDIAVSWLSDAGSINIDGTEFKVEQFHWHFPSEHTTNGERYDAELHLVHKSSDGRIAVVGILYHFGAPDPFVSKLFGNTPLPTPDAERVVGIVSPYDIGLDSRFYYRYVGSLTSPPCTEDVIWTVLKKPMRISRSQVNAIANAHHEEYKMTARPSQKVNNRDVHLHEQF